MTTPHSFQYLENEVAAWAHARGITQNSTPIAQFLKTVEETGEVARALAKNDQAQFEDGVGDVLVTLINVCTMRDTDLTTCLARAWDEIKDRKGFLNEYGVFVKED